MPPPRSVLIRYHHALDELVWRRAPAGFSGAEVWRGDDAAGTPLFALKCWPADYSASRLAEIHRRLWQARHLAFVPRILPTAAGITVVTDENRLWDAAEWMPGYPRDAPSEAEFESACAAIAQLHAAWRIEESREPAPGVINRLRILGEWLQRPSQAKRFNTCPDALRDVLRRSIEVVDAAAPAAQASLRPWASVPLPVQTCVRDLRADHVLHSGDEVTGIIDFGALGRDYPGVDLARYLGDASRTDETRFRSGLNAYRAVGGILAKPDDLIHQLDRSGVVCSLIGWIVRTRAKNRLAGLNPQAISTRVESLLTRISR